MGSMYKRVFDTMLFFDTEYVPCLDTARKIYKLTPEDFAEEEVLNEVYRLNNATEADPTPMLKFLLYRVVAISGLIRKVSYNSDLKRSEVTLNLFSLPKELEDGFQPEKEIIEKFLQSIGKNHAQIVGWAIDQFDLNVLFQRATVNKCIIPDFCKRPDKPWEGNDYFTKNSDAVLDLMDCICGWGSRSRARLDEMALACGIPGKLGIDGSEVCGIFYDDGLEGWRRIIAYCECDVMTTYLIWLDTALMGGFLTNLEYERERRQCYFMLVNRIDGGAIHFQPFLDAWSYHPNNIEATCATCDTIGTEKSEDGECSVCSNNENS